MKTLAILSRKGGTGKTTLAVHLSVAAEEAGLTTALIDLDPQASAAKWSDRREGDSPVVISAHAARLPQILHTAEQSGVDLAVIDTSPKTEDDARDAAEAACFALIPCRPGMFDLEAIGSTVRIGAGAKVPMRVVFNAVPARSSIIFRAKKAIEVYDVSCAPTLIGERVAFSYSIIDGQVAQEFEPSGKASMEIRSLYRYLAKEMGV